MRWAALITLPLLLSAQGLWERRAPYPVSLTEVSGAEIGGRIYSLCGLTPQGPTNALYIYDPSIDSWTSGAPLPITPGADHCNVAAVNGKLYLLGAIRIGSTFVEANTYMYDPAANRWETVASMPTPRGASGVAVIGNRIYVAGGLALNGSVVASFEVFDTETRLWSQLPSMPTARDHLTAQAVNGKFYAIAGRNGGITNVQGPTEEFDPETSAWRTRAPIPVVRGGLGSGVINGRIIVFGGEGNSGRPEQTFQENHEYDPATDTWRALAPMPTPRHGLYGISLEGRIFVPGGGPVIGGSYSNVHEAFYLPPSQSPALTTAWQLASKGETLTPGALVSLSGANLSLGRQSNTRPSLSTQMNAVRVSVNGRDVPLLLVSPEQVTVHLPWDVTTGSARITVNNATSESQPLDIMLEPEPAPGIFSLDSTGSGYGVILIEGTAIVAQPTRDAFSRPARRGEAVEIYCTGLGAVENPPAAGQPASAEPLLRTLVNPVVMIGGVEAEILFSGLAPGGVGLYRVDARIASNTATGGAVPVTIRMGARTSNQVLMAVME